MRPKKVETAVQGCKVPLLTDDNPQPDDHTRRSTDAQLTMSKKKRVSERKTKEDLVLLRLLILLLAFFSLFPSYGKSGTGYS